MPALLDNTTAPRSVLTLSTARDRVRGDLGLTDSSLLTDANLLAWLNEAQDLLALHTRWFRTYDISGTTSGTKEYALPTPTAGRCIQIEEIRHDDRQLVPITQEELLFTSHDYQREGSGTPQYYYLRGNTGFGLHPTPGTTDADAITVIYVARPPHLSAANENFYVPHGAEYALVVYAKLLASEKDMYGEGARRVELYRQQWEQALSRVKRQVDQAAERQAAVMGDKAVMGGGRRKHPWHTTITG